MNTFQDLGEPTPWTQDASCATTDPDAFFPEGHAPYKDATRICGGCSVATECLTYALRHNIEDGIWGGRTPRQRARMVKETA